MYLLFLDYRRPLKSMSLSILLFICASKSTIENWTYQKSPNFFFADGNFLYSRQEIYVVFMSQSLFRMAIFFILDRYFPKTVHQYLFCIKQARKMCTLLSTHFWALKYNFRWFVSDSKSYILKSPIQILALPDRRTDNIGLWKLCDTKTMEL